MVKKFFEVSNKNLGLSRLGRIRCVHEDVITPCYIPVVPFLDGTDESIRTENITKSFPKLPGLSQVLLHNNDGKLTKGQQRKLNTKIHDTHKHYKGAVFLDSGGFKLIRMDIDDMPPEEIFNIQEAVGGDIFFTLDYPIIDVMPFKMQIKRAKKSIDNAIAALKIRKEKWGTDIEKPYVYVAVHGTSTQFVYDYLTEFFKQLKKEKLEDVPFGLAQGSLVPLKGKRHLVLDFLYTTKKFLIERKLEKSIPIHAFGMSGPLIPYMVLLGIDTFDSASYLLSAGNHQLFDPKTLELVSVMQKDDIAEKNNYCWRHNLNPNDYNNLKEVWNCDCNWCTKAKNANPAANENIIDFAHLIQDTVRKGDWRKNPEFLTYLKDRNFIMLDNLYVHMICHNLTVLNNFVAKIHQTLKDGTFGDFFIDYIQLRGYKGSKRDYKRTLQLLKPILINDKDFYNFIQEKVENIGDLLIDENLEDIKKKQILDFNIDTSDTPLHPGKHKKVEKKLASKRKEEKEAEFEELDLL